MREMVATMVTSRMLGVVRDRPVHEEACRLARRHGRSSSHSFYGAIFVKVVSYLFFLCLSFFVL